jgi:hypothetical protein
MSTSDKKPASKLSLYPLSAAIWRNENQKGEAFYSTTFQRTYKDKDGNLKNSDSFNASELLLLAKLADLAHSEVIKLRANDRNAQPEEEAIPL